VTLYLEYRLKVLENRTLEKHLDLQNNKEYKAGENCLTSNFRIYTPHHILKQ